MYRMFKTKGGRSARAAEGQERRPRRRRLDIEALEGRQLLSLGNEFAVNSLTGNSQFESDNASSANGRSVAVWTTTFSPTDHDIKGQIYSSSGQPLGFELVINEDGFDERHPSVAMDDFGNFVVAYERGISTDTGNLPQKAIVAQRFNGSGNPIGSLITVTPADNASPNAHFGRDPDVAMDASGEFVVSFTKVSGSPFGTGGNQQIDVSARRYDSSGNAIGGEIHVADGSSNQENSSVAMSPDGRFDVAFEVHDSLGDRIFLRRYNAAGGFIEELSLANGNNQVFHPSVAMDNLGNAVVAYQEFGGTNFDIKAQRVSNIGIVGGEITIRNTPAPERIPSVALSRTGGSFVVAYVTDLLGSAGANRTVEVREFNASNVPGSGFNLPASPNNSSPALSIDPSGRYLLSYTGGIGGDQNIFARRGNLPIAPQAQILKLTQAIHAGQSALLSGQLVDANGDTKLTLTVSWGDGSKPQQTKPGAKPFALTHKYVKPGTYFVRVTWTDSTGLSNSQVLKLTVTKPK